MIDVDTVIRKKKNVLNRLGHRDPHAAWEALRERYDVAASQSARVVTLARLHSAVMKPEVSVSDYISSLSDISQELEGTPDEVTERYLIMRIFATLPEQFANIVCHEMWLGRGPGTFSEMRLIASAHCPVD